MYALYDRASATTAWTAAGERRRPACDRQQRLLLARSRRSARPRSAAPEPRSTSSWGPYADELAAESEQALGRAPLGRDRALAVPDQLAGQGAQAPKAARHPESDVGELLREDERADKGARVGQLAGDDPAAACLAEADRDLRARLHEVELGQLAGAVARALEAARRRQKARPQFPQQVIEIVLPPRYPTASSSSRMRTPDSLGSSPPAPPRSSQRTHRASRYAADAARSPAARTTPATCGSCPGGCRCGDGSPAARDPRRASSA
jgi:hypothetical protein